MLMLWHHDVRTTLTLDADVAAKLKSLARRMGRAFVVNERLRRGLVSQPAAAARRPFQVKARDLGALRPGLDVDNIGETLEGLEGPLHR